MGSSGSLPFEAGPPHARPQVLFLDLHPAECEEVELAGIRIAAMWALRLAGHGRGGGMRPQASCEPEAGGFRHPGGGA